MKRYLFCWILFLCAVPGLQAQEKVVDLKFVQTSDIHGNYFPFNFIENKSWDGSLSRVYAFVREQREKYGDRVILLDNGDILQGQPTAYYYNFIDTVSPHLVAQIMNYMGYDAGTLGNHDVETGHAVYDRWIGECRFPVLGANVIRTSDGTPYLKPYEIIERDGVKIAILGMITPAIPTWLPERLWEGLRFDDMEETARKWIQVIREEEKADIVVGLFHSGKESNQVAGKYNENASVDIARNIPGFDMVMFGHDHLRECSKIVNAAGDSVLLINPASNGFVVADVDLKLTLKDGKVVDKTIDGKLTDLKKYAPDEEFMNHFNSQEEVVKNFVSKRIGRFTKGITTRCAYFGPSSFIDLIHRLQLELTGADVSFTAPLSFDAHIAEGDVTVADMFNLYKYENFLYTITMTGQEIKDYLEMSYALWSNQMKSPDDPILLLKAGRAGDDRQTFVNFSFNFDSAAGILYTVDVTRPQGEKIRVTGMADGRPFEPDKTYKVALNSYRGNGGGELLTKGAGIAPGELKDRIVYSTDKDLRYYLMKYIEKKGTIDPEPLGQWKFIPEEWTVPASRRDYRLLFGED